MSPTKPLRGAGFRNRFSTDGALASLIRTGVKGTSMDAFRKDRLSDDQLSDIIAYIRTLPQPDSAGKSDSGNAVRTHSAKSAIPRAVQKKHM